MSEGKDWVRILYREDTPFIFSTTTSSFRKQFNNYLFTFYNDIGSYYIPKEELIQSSKKFVDEEKDDLKQVAENIASLDVKEKTFAGDDLIKENWPWFKAQSKLFKKISNYAESLSGTDVTDIPDNKLIDTINKVFKFYAKLGDSVILLKFPEDKVDKFYEEYRQTVYPRAPNMKKLTRQEKESLLVYSQMPLFHKYDEEFDKLLARINKSNFFDDFIEDIDDLIEKEQIKSLDNFDTPDFFTYNASQNLKNELSKKILNHEKFGNEVQNLCKKYAWKYTGMGFSKSAELLPKDVSNLLATRLLGLSGSEENNPKRSRFSSWYQPIITLKQIKQNALYRDQLMLREVKGKIQELKEKESSLARVFRNDILPYATLVRVNSRLRTERRGLVSKLYYYSYPFFKEILKRYDNGLNANFFSETVNILKDRKPETDFEYKNAASFRAIGYFTKEDFRKISRSLAHNDDKLDSNFLTRYEKRVSNFVLHRHRGNETSYIDQEAINFDGGDFNPKPVNKNEALVGSPRGNYWRDKTYGTVHVARKLTEIWELSPGDILVTITASPDHIPYFNQLNGIVTESGGTTSHPVLMAQKFQIPLITGVEGATRQLNDNDLISLDPNTGKVAIESSEADNEKVMELLRKILSGG